MTATTTHDISISCEPPSRNGALVLRGGHRARCSCGWASDCYAQLSDTERAFEIHLRRSRCEDFKDLIARSSIGTAIADVKARGIDAHLDDLERAMNRRRPARKKPKAKKLSPEEASFLRGFGTALASIWRCHHDGQMIRHLIKQNNFTFAAFRDVGLLDTDLAAIQKAVLQ